MEDWAGGGDEGGVLGGVELSDGLSPLEDDEEDGGVDSLEPALLLLFSSSAPSNRASSFTSSVSTSDGSVGCFPLTQRGYANKGDGRAYLVTEDEDR